MYSHYRNLHDGLFVDWGKLSSQVLKSWKFSVNIPTLSMNNLLCHHIYIFMFRRICKNARIWYLYCAFLSMHWTFWSQISVIISRIVSHFRNCRNIIYGKESLCHIWFLEMFVMLILLFSWGWKFTTKSTLQEQNRTNISLHFSECKNEPSLAFVFFFLSTNLTNVTICGKLYEFY